MRRVMHDVFVLFVDVGVRPHKQMELRAEHLACNISPGGDGDRIA